ncbi:MAG TPA: hypothetical protein VGF59_31635 [Bryobacteraceae bacterium]
MALRDDADREIVVYLRSLLDHANACDSPACPRCDTLQSVCELVSGLLFSNDYYSEARSTARARHSVDGIR